MVYMLLASSNYVKIGEDKDLSVMTNVDLKKLFPGKKIDRVTEMNLSANQERAEMVKKRLAWKRERLSTGAVTRGGVVDPIKLVVELAPMEIRTLIVGFAHAMERPLMHSAL
ncbi:hypothetical protein Tsubulata_006931 [Turnera subulata]|uniref:Glycosyl hydrolases family 38 C-terminal domain-containing protein n=1 Tax=Turnera subulata TaxID=218843 RepID=A0A9Q0GDI2_9ROSI|nr:hypothetical protein Tsubulata_006931 [Turnera subulata]